MVYPETPHPDSPTSKRCVPSQSRSCPSTSPGRSCYPSAVVYQAYLPQASVAGSVKARVRSRGARGEFGYVFNMTKGGNGEGGRGVQAVSQRAASQQEAVAMEASRTEAEASRIEYAPDGPEAQRIARTIPYFPFKGIDRFYDIGGIKSIKIMICLCVRRLCHTRGARSTTAAVHSRVVLS